MVSKFASWQRSGESNCHENSAVGYILGKIEHVNSIVDSVMIGEPGVSRRSSVLWLGNSYVLADEIF